MKKQLTISRRQFLLSSAVASAGFILPEKALAGKKDTLSGVEPPALKGRSAFVMWQIPSHSNTIGNSYVFQTRTGKVIVMDGGFPEEAFTMRGFLGALGNEVEELLLVGDDNVAVGCGWEGKGIVYHGCQKRI
jgi:hypothetical protein